MPLTIQELRHIQEVTRDVLQISDGSLALLQHEALKASRSGISSNSMVASARAENIRNLVQSIIHQEACLRSIDREIARYGE